MIKDALQYLVNLKDNKTYQINGGTYSDNELHYVRPHIDRPDILRVNGLDSIVQLIKNDAINTGDYPLFVRIASPRDVTVYGSLDSHAGRNVYYSAKCDAAEFTPKWYDHDSAIIALRSMFVENEGCEYLLDLLSRISVNDSVESDDNGVSQTITAKKGVSLKSFERVRNRVTLAPFRTFIEVPQPESDFIIRLDDGGRIGILEADGGAWALKAKANIYEFFRRNLDDEVMNRKVVLMM